MVRASRSFAPSRRFLSAVLAGAFAFLNAVSTSPCQEPPGDAARALREASEMRRLFDPAVPPVEASWKPLDYRGRPSFEITGRAAEGEGLRPVLDFAVYDRESARIVMFVSFLNASRRQAGEAVLPMSEIATRADAQVRAFLGGEAVALQGIERYRPLGQESVYYEVRYASQGKRVRFLRPPVSLLFDGSTGKLFRFEIEAAWFDPPPDGPRLLSRRSAERIAAASLRGPRLTEAFGEGATLGKVTATELCYLRPNGWLGFVADGNEARTRLAWLLSFSVDNARQGGAQTLFLDAMTGRVLGGQEGPPP